MRAVLLFGFLFILPLAIYAGYLNVIRYMRKTEGPTWSEVPLTRLFIAGLALMAAGMVVTAYVIGEDPDGVYVPARMENGKLVPGDVKNE